MGETKRLKRLQDRQAALVGAMNELLDAADAEGRDLSEDETKAYAEHEKELAGVKASLAREEKLQDYERTLRRVPESVGELVPAEPKADEAPAKFASFGEQLAAVARYSLTEGRVCDPRLKWRAAVSGMNEGTPADGGFLVQQDYATDLMSRAYNSGQILQRVRRVGVSPNSNGLKINMIDETSRVNGSRFGGVRAYWGNEGFSPTATAPTFRQMELNLKKLMGLCYATEELLADAAALEAVVRLAFTEEVTFVLEDSVINGTGAGQPLGILNSGCLVTVTKETGQAAATLVKENIDKMWMRGYARSRQNAVWLINQDIEPQLNSLSQVVGTGGVPVYLPPGGLSSSPFSSLYGRPVIPVEYCATLGTVGDIILADLSQYLMIDKGGVQTASSMHVRFINDEMTFRFVYRADGQPTWNSALTPFKGSNTLSPFVVVGTRS